MKRRDFITLLGGAAAVWPLAARAQQPAMPVVGYLSSGTAVVFADVAAAFADSLGKAGFVSGKTVTIDYRWAEGKYDRLPAMAADLARQADVIVASGGAVTALAAKAATSTVPIVFIIGDDPVQYGLVASFNRPGGNVTGIYDINEELGGKRLGLLHDLLPAASHFALLKQNSAASESMIAGVRAGAAAIGRSFEVITANNDREIEAAFGTMVQNRIDALLVQPQTLFQSSRPTGDGDGVSPTAWDLWRA